jgi:hypothetical protein
MAMTRTRAKKTTVPRAKVPKPIKNSTLDYSKTDLALKRILACAREELELIREMKAEAARYRQDALKKADSEGRRLILNAGLMKHREIEEVIRQASEEIQKILADIRITRISIQEELAVQRDFAKTDKLNGIFTSIKSTLQKPAVNEMEKRPESIRY